MIRRIRPLAGWFDILRTVPPFPGPTAERPGDSAGNEFAAVYPRFRRLAKPGCRYTCAPPPAGRLLCDEDLCGNTGYPRAQLARGRRDRQDAGPPGDPDRRCAARKAQAGLHASHRRGRLRGRRERREDLGDRQQACGEALLPPFRLPGWAPQPHARRDARAPARGGRAAGREGHAAANAPGPRAAPQAQGLRRARPSPRRAEARADGGKRLMIEEPQQPEGEEAPSRDETPEGVPGEPGEATPSETDPPADAPREEPADPEAPGPEIEGLDELGQAATSEGEEPAADEPAADAAPEEAARDKAAPERPRARKEKDARGEDVIPGAHLEPDLVLEEQRPEGGEYDEYGEYADPDAAATEDRKSVV